MLKCLTTSEKRSDRRRVGRWSVRPVGSLRLRLWMVGACLAGLALSGPAAIGDGHAAVLTPVPVRAADCSGFPGGPDFDGDCLGDVVAGAPRWDVSGAVDAGAVQVTSAAATEAEPTSALITASRLGFTDQAHAAFGTTLLAADMDGIEPLDLVVGAPGTTVDGVLGAGAVYVIYGAPSGLGTGRATVRLTEKALGVAGQASHFGAALALWEAPGSDPAVSNRLAVGSPWARVGSKAKAGRVLLIDSATLRLSAELSQGRGAPGRSEAGDHFGAALTSVPAYTGYLVIGVPDEDVGSVRNAGSVAVIGQDRQWSFSEQTTRVPSKARRNDRFGAAVTGFEGQPFGDEASDGVMVAAPGKDVGSARDAGALVMLDLVGCFEPTCPMWTSYPELISANSPGFAGRAEPGDHLGVWLSRAQLGYGVLVGIPDEDAGRVRNAGAFCAIRVREITARGKVPADCIGQNTAGVSGVAESGDRFGAAVASFGAGGSDDIVDAIAVSTPGEDVGRLTNLGTVQVGTLENHGDQPVATFDEQLPPAAKQSGGALGRSLMR